VVALVAGTANAERSRAGDEVRGRPRVSAVVRVAQEDLSRSRGREQRIRHVETIAAHLVGVARDRRMCKRREALRLDAVRARPRGDPLLVETGDASVQDGVVVLDEADGAVARLARVTRTATARLLVRRRRHLNRHTWAAPREPAVRRAVHPDAARVIRPVEVDLRVVRDALTVVDDRGIAAAVQVVTAGK